MKMPAGYLCVRIGLFITLYITSNNCAHPCRLLIMCQAAVLRSGKSSGSLAMARATFYEMFILT